MAKYRVKEVKGFVDLVRFVRFANRLYRGCGEYVPSLDMDQILTLRRNPALEYCRHRMWMVLDGSKVVGRICAMVNPRYNERYGTKRCRFGWFDCVEEFEVAKLLIDTASEWAREEGMEEIHGPLFFNTLGKQGMLVEGFENVPPFNCLYNFPYYVEFVERLGFRKECDWVQKKVRVTEAPERIARVSARLMERHQFSVADIDSLKHDKALINQFFKIYNESFAASVYNFIPFTEAEIASEAAAAIPMLDKRISCVLLDAEGEVAAFGICFPSMSRTLQWARGSLLRFAWLRFWSRSFGRAGDLGTIDMMLTGAAPKWQNTGISAMIHTLMSAQFVAAGVQSAITNPQIETNSAVNVWASYSDVAPYMRRRCFVRSL